MIRTNIVIAAVAVLGFSMGTTRVAAQHETHQMPGATTSANANVSACGQNAALVSSAIDQANARVEEARQLNDPAKLRAAVADVQLTLTQMKAQLADCVALNQPAAMGNMPGMDHSKMNMSGATPTQPGAATSAQPMSHTNMPGMDHSKMNMPPSPAAAAPAEQAKTASSGTVDIAFKSDPSPARAGDNKFEVTVKDKAGKPVTGASVSLAFYMPPMGSMGAMRNTVKLASVGNGVYRGEGSVGMAGDWDVTITVTRGQQQLGSKKIKLAAQ